MTSIADWIALAERCEKAIGQDREIDWCIHAAILNWPAEIKPKKPGDPEYTRSLDAITALIERELPGWDWSTAKSHGHCRANVWRLSPISRGSFPPKHATATTAALALCVVFCRAMAEKAE
jgi:hypothetical protein